MAVILMDFTQNSEWRHMCLCSLYFLLQHIFVQCYLLDKCIGYFQKLENKILTDNDCESCDRDQCTRWSSAYDAHPDSGRLGSDTSFRHRIIQVIVTKLNAYFLI